ncbi:type IV pilin [Halohasta litorea]|uniref:Type IV pilin n=1 Tax=Halohasta litorea TaxID=869891 RepID=A0ABD6D5P1_9EURY|nr:type IV pilin N-terminal domain-containing protein [Halohasta litorea]
MHTGALDSGDRGASPVVGIILLVAITVILASVVGTYAFGSGGQVPGEPPQTSFSFDYDEQTNLTISHNGGENLDNDTIEVRIDRTEAYPEPDTAATNITDASGWSTPISSGDDLELYNDSGEPIAKGGDTVRIVWLDPSGGASNTLDEDEWPN